eukprot:2708715-Amphidinium_carterae.1
MVPSSKRPNTRCRAQGWTRRCSLQATLVLAFIGMSGWSTCFQKGSPTSRGELHELPRRGVMLGLP